MDSLFKNDLSGKTQVVSKKKPRVTPSSHDTPLTTCSCRQEDLIYSGLDIFGNEMYWCPVCIENRHEKRYSRKFDSETKEELFTKEDKNSTRQDRLRKRRTG